MSEKAFDTVEKAETQPGASEPVEVENAVNAEDQQGTYSQYLRRTTGNCNIVFINTILDLVAEETYQLTVLLPRESGQIQVLVSNCIKSANYNTVNLSQYNHRQVPEKPFMI
jgi:hypothetical protein